MENPRTPGQRAGLTQAKVVAAARELLAEGGPAALSMRALARRLDVLPNSLYSHVASKTALIDAVLDDVLGQVQAPTPDVANPVAGLESLMSSTYEVLLAHQELVAIYLARQGASGPNAVRLGEVMFALLDRVGVQGRRAREALRVLIVFTIGFAAFTTRPALEPNLDPKETKLSPADLNADFLTGLRWLLNGIVDHGSPAGGVGR